MNIEQTRENIMLLLKKAKHSTNDLNSPFSLTIIDGIGTLNFSDVGEEFFTNGYKPQLICGVGISMKSDEAFIMLEKDDESISIVKAKGFPFRKEEWEQLLTVLQKCLIQEGVIEE